jgi:hypothetical protein
VTPEQKRITDEYVSFGRMDGHYWAAWEGQNIIEKMQNSENAMRDALIAEVRARARTVRTPRIPSARKLVDLTRGRVEPMVRGLFPRAEQDHVLGLLEKSVVFVSPRNVEQLIREQSFGHSAWTVANLFLLYVGAELLSDEAPRIVGFSEATTCFVSPEYLSGRGAFEDFIVHEAAHVFHNWKRRYAGLPHTRRKEWLLEIEFRKRETFAYSCEVYSRILEQGRTPKERTALLEQYRLAPFGPEHVEVGTNEHLDILNEAVRVRNGWKRILARCAPPRRP